MLCREFRVEFLVAALFAIADRDGQEDAALAFAAGVVGGCLRRVAVGWTGLFRRF